LQLGIGVRDLEATMRRYVDASCRTWGGDDPNAATNLRFRTTYEN
jgi:hypothetical protein